MQTFFSWASLISSAILVSCAVYGPEQLPPGSGGSAGGGAGTAITGGAGGSSDAGTDTSAGGAGSSGGSGGFGGTGGNGGSGGSGKGGTAGATTGTGGAGGGGKGGAAGGGAAGSIDAGAGSGGTGGTTGGAAGSGSTTGTGGDAGTSGAAGTTGGTGATGGAAGSGGVAGTGGAAGSIGTGGAAGVSGASGAGGASGSAGAGGTIDAGQPPGAVFAVGSFGKNTGNGSQTIAHTLGQTPKAILFWTVGKTGETASSSYLYSIGVTDTQTSMSVAMGERDGQSPSSSSRRMANKVLTLVQGGETTVAEADLTSVGASNFVLNWTANDSQPYIVHYLAIGGPQAQAKVINWQAPTSTGNRSVTGIPFTPQIVFHFYLGGAFVGAAPTSQPTGVMGMGVMNAAGEQWANQVAAATNQSPTVAGRAQKTDSTIYTYTDVTSSAVSKQASFVSMNSNGFTVNFSSANSSASQIVSLALGGVKADIGNFNKSTATGNQSITAGFQPGALFLASYQTGAQSGSAVSVSHERLGMGASDGTHEGSSAIMSVDNVATSAADGIDKTSRVFVKVDNTSNTTDAEASLASFGATGFTLNWSKNDGAATQMCYVALAAP